MSDLSATNIDEFAPFLAGTFPIFFVEGNTVGQLFLLAATFLAFRILDGAKPQWAKRFEDKHEGTGWGVMVDDLVVMIPITIFLSIAVLFVVTT